MKQKKTLRRISLFLIAFVFVFGVFSFSKKAYATQTDISMPSISVNFGGTDNENTETSATTNTMQLVFLVVLLALAPSIFMVLTCFTRIIIVFHFLRSALGTQQMPPNQVMIGLALFLTIFLMSPTFEKINAEAVQPLSRGEITQEEAVTRGLSPLREFMFKQADKKDIALFSQLAGKSYDVDVLEEIPTTVLIPSFILGEVTKGFKIGFLIYMPFIVIDMVVASTLMAMGMMMLPPAMISLPFKILLFIMVNGWNLVVESLILTFR